MDDVVEQELDELSADLDLGDIGDMNLSDIDLGDIDIDMGTTEVENEKEEEKPKVKIKAKSKKEHAKGSGKTKEKKPPKAVEAKKTTGEKIEAEIADVSDLVNLEVESDEDFDPEQSILEVQKHLNILGKSWFRFAKVVTPMIEQAKVFFKKDKEGLQDWYSRCGLGKAQRNLLLNAGKQEDFLIGKMVDNNITSSKFKSLSTLRDPELMEEFLDKETHTVEIDGEEVEVKTSTMSTEQVKDAVKAIRKANGDPPKEVPLHDLFVKFISKLNTNLTVQWDDMKKFKSFKGLKVKDFTDELKTEVKTALETVEEYHNAMEKMAKKLKLI